MRNLYRHEQDHPEKIIGANIKLLRGSNFPPVDGIIRPWIEIIRPWIEIIRPWIEIIRPWIEIIRLWIEIIRPWMEIIRPWMELSSRGLNYPPVD